jgi:hypothetical protein
VGCKRTSKNTAPYCVLEADDTDSVPCHLDAGGVVSSGGGECLYVAESMTYATAERRCAAGYANGGMCEQRRVKLGVSTIDGQSSDWQATCAGFMLSWSSDPCTSVPHIALHLYLACFLFACGVQVCVEHGCS